MKKMREETTEYWHDEETGRVVVKTEEKFLVTEKGGEERWVTYSKTLPLV